MPTKTPTFCMARQGNQRPMFSRLTLVFAHVSNVLGIQGTYGSSLFKELFFPTGLFVKCIHYLNKF